MILVFGSINLDLVATVATLPRAGETQIAAGFREAPGGKGANQALAARRAGAEVALHGAVGRDGFGAAALALLRDAGVSLQGVVDVDAPTGVALIHVDATGENTITVVPGANALARAAWIADDRLGPHTTLLLQLEVAIAEVESLAPRARARGARVVLNAAPAQALSNELLDAVDVLVVNQHEASAVHGTRGPQATSPQDFARSLAGPRRAVVVTLGADGALAQADGRTLRVDAPTVHAVDTVGAGDAFAGALAAALDAGSTLAEALPFAATAGALACTRRGAQEAMAMREDIVRLAPSARLRPA